MSQQISCKECDKRCRKNQKYQQCCKCKKYIHQRCTNFSPRQFLCFTNPQGQNPLVCHLCTVQSHTSVRSSTGTARDGSSTREEQNHYTYQNLSSLNSEQKSEGDLLVMHMNIVSLVANLDEVKSLISQTKFAPDLICITETRLKDKKIDWQSMIVNLPNYELCYDNSKTSAGGVTIYIHESIKDFDIKSELKIDVHDCESLFLEIRFDKSKSNDKTSNTKKSLLVGCVYRHPRWATSLFIDRLCEKLAIYSAKNIPIVLVGDFNLNVLDRSCNRAQNYINMLSSIGCHNMVDVPTCFSDTSQTCLDHVITNIEKENISHGVLDDSPTNHLPVYAILKGITDPSIKKQKEKNNEAKWRNIDERKKEKFLEILAEKFATLDLDEHPENILFSLTRKTQEAIDVCFPLKTKSNRAKKRSLTPWYNTEIFREEKKQSRLFRRFRKSKNVDDLKAYKAFRKNLSKKKYKAKRAYFHQVLYKAKNSEDRRATWEVINKAFGKNKKKRVYPEEVQVGDPSNPTTSKCPKDIANVLNGHFTSIAKNLAENLDTTKYKYSDFMGVENKSNMYLKLIELHEILEEIKGICVKKAKGYDEIYPKLIKWAADLYAPVLLIIFNKSIELGYYPEAMKIGQVAPLFKKGDKNVKTNYRPITVLTQFNQIFEHLLSKRYLSFFEKFNIITKKQFGFLKKHCTEHAILDLKEYIMSKLDNKDVMAVLFLDLQKAFDTVSHDIILKKLYHYGVRGKAHHLLKSYLSNRKQRTKVGNVLSDIAFVLWGVPQGSVLGPLLFLIFINDLPNVSDLLSSWLFADDTALALSSPNIQDLELKFNQEVNKVHEWLLANRLSVHYSDKTQFMLIQGPNQKDRRILSQNFKLHMGVHEIEKIDNYTYLGVIFDEKLNWKLQVDKLCSKLSSVCGILSKVRHYLDRSSLMLIYNSLFDSRLRYGSLGWGTSAEQHLSRIRVLQNRAIRFITFSSFRSSVAPLYSKLNILPLNEQLFLQKTIFMHSLHHKNLPFTLSTYCKQPIHRYSTRYKSDGNYILPCPATNRSQRSIKFSGPRAWSEVPKHLKEVAFRKTFSKLHKKYILNQIHVDMPPKRRSSPENVVLDVFELNLLFESDDENGEFFGFEESVENNDTSFFDLRQIFNASNSDEEFLGFNNTSSANLNSLFLNSSNDTEFLGF